MITKEVKVNLKATPILEWRWRVVTLPKGADARSKHTAAQAGQLYVVWPRFPREFRSRIIGYLWAPQAPQGLVVKSEKTSTVTYIVVRSGPAELGKWLTERRKVVEDYKQIYGEEPENPGAVSVTIDSDDTNSSAESFLGAIIFTKPRRTRRTSCPTSPGRKRPSRAAPTGRSTPRRPPPCGASESPTRCANAPQ